MKSAVTSVIVASFLCLPAGLFGQAESSAPISNTMPSSDFGFNLPTNLGTLSYSLTASEMFETGYGSVDANTALSGNLAYISKSEKAPFSAVYSGGVFFSSEPGYSSVETFQSVAASQVYKTRSWVFVGSDAFSYLPQAPTTGLAGVPGIGDIGVPPVQTGLGPQVSILSNYAPQITNGLTGSATWQTSPSLDLQASGDWQILRYTGDVSKTGLDTSTVGGTFGPNYRIDARNSIGAEAYYSDSTYPNYPQYGLESEGVNLSYNRTWTRRLSTTVSFGPERTHGTSFTGIPSDPSVIIPFQWNLAGSASVTYATRTTGFSGSFSRGVNAGSGVLFGSITDTVSVGMSRPINRDWNMSYQLGYNHNVGLAPINGALPVYDSVFGAAQVAHRLTETLSLYASYTPIWQSAQNQPYYATPAFTGFNNIFSIGITFAPAPLVSGR